MNRISRHSMWLEVAHTIAKRATCSRLNVGVVIVRNKRIISTGYNGPSAGSPHCTGPSCPRSDVGACIRSLHAEVNALARYDGELPFDENMTVDIYCTHSPCMSCAGFLIDANVHRVFFQTAFRDETPLLKLTSAGLLVYRVTPNGQAIIQPSGEFADPL